MRPRRKTCSQRSPCSPDIYRIHSRYNSRNRCFPRTCPAGMARTNRSCFARYLANTSRHCRTYNCRATKDEVGEGETRSLCGSALKGMPCKIPRPQRLGTTPRDRTNTLRGSLPLQGPSTAPWNMHCISSKRCGPGKIQQGILHRRIRMFVLHRCSSIDHERTPSTQPRMSAPDPHPSTFRGDTPCRRRVCHP